MSFVDANLLEELINAAVEAAVQRALVRVPQPRIVHGTLIDLDAGGQSIHTVVVDGDVDPVYAHDVTTASLLVGDRVTVVFAPPHQALIIGLVRTYSQIVAQQVLTNTATFGDADEVTDMLIDDVPFVAGRVYGLHMHSQSLWPTLDADARVTLDCRIEGTTVGRFDDFQTPPGTFRRFIDSIVLWTATSTGNLDLDVFANEVVASIGVTLEASATVPRTLTVIDYGTPEML